MTRAGVARALWAVVLGASLVLLVKAFVLDVYHVDSGSMEPTIHGSPEDGERVLVVYRRAPALERFDLAVILRAGEGEPVVKRVVGLPGETVRARGDDLFIDGKRLAADAPRPELIPVFDSRTQALASGFVSQSSLLTRTGASWNLDARGERGSEFTLCYQPKLADGHLGAAGEPVAGTRPVGDAALETALRFEPAAECATLSWSLTEEGDLFRAELSYADGRARLRLVRASFEVATETLAESERPLDPARAHAALLSNADNVVRFEWDGECVLQASYERNRPVTGVPDEVYRHRLPRACFGALGCTVELSRVRLLRDLYYTERGEHGTLEATLPLGPDEIFVLGDNSAESRDSREWGPVALREVIGVPVAVVWPPSRMRWLAGAQPPRGPGERQGESSSSR